jgi:glyoxylase-like metal-dependent hydrolase (beta-lactamase superfamily II)
MPRVTALAGFAGKGPACFLVEIGGRRLLLDLGEGPDADQRPDVSGVEPIDAILISHGHPDHVGALDLADRLGAPPIHATAPVRALAKDRRLADARDLPLVGAAEIAGIAVETGPAGHAPGAVWLRLGGGDGLLYTGDYSAESPLYPATAPLPAAALIVDASYGAADEPLAAQASDLTARARTRPLLLPCPAAGRALEMALVFRAAGVPVTLCATSRAVSETALRFPAAMLPGAAAALADLLTATAPLAADSPATGVMIVAGAQADDGLAADLCRRFTATSEADIVFTGHIAAGGAAEAMLRAGTASFRRWNVHPTRAGLAALVAAVNPRLVMPAFVDRDGIAALADLRGNATVTEDVSFSW